MIIKLHDQIKIGEKDRWCVKTVFSPVVLIIIVISGSYMNATVNPAMTIDTIDISLMRMLSDGPLVSLNGSPTVSPTIVAL